MTDTLKKPRVRTKPHDPKARRQPPSGITVAQAAEFLAKPVGIIYELDGRLLNKLLQETGATQTELAEFCGYTGVSRVSHMIRGVKGSGVSNVGSEPMEKIAEFFRDRGVTINLRFAGGIDKFVKENPTG